MEKKMRLHHLEEVEQEEEQLKELEEEENLLLQNLNKTPEIILPNREVGVEFKMIEWLAEITKGPFKEEEEVWEPLDIGIEWRKVE